MKPVTPGLQNEYAARINRVIDYIDAHLDEELSLETLAGVALFSPYHFHRIFSAMVGEPPGRFILRLRLERAAALLAANLRMSITTIALDCGFSGSAAFARAFREAFGMTASDWRKKCKAERKETQASGKQGKDSLTSSMYVDNVHHHITWRIHMNDTYTNITVADLPEMPIAYIRHIGPYKGDSDLFKQLFTRLMTWAGPRGLLAQSDMKCLAIYHDDPDITVEEKLRLSVAITVPPETEAEGEIGRITLPGGKYALAHFELAPDEYEQAWKIVYGGWLPQSGYQPADSPCFEWYLNNPEEHPEGKHILKICIPVKPL